MLSPSTIKVLHEELARLERERSAINDTIAALGKLLGSNAGEPAELPVPLIPKPAPDFDHDDSNLTNTELILRAFHQGEELRNADLVNRTTLDSHQIGPALVDLARRGLLHRVSTGLYRRPKM